MKKIAIDEFAKLKMQSHVTYSPKGKNVCFVVTQPSVEHNTYLSNIYQLVDGEPKQLTSDFRGNNFVFLDDDTILYKSGGDEVSSVYTSVDLKTGKAKKAFTLPLAAGPIVPLKGGKFIVQARTYPGYEDMYTGDKKIAKAYLKEREDMADYEEFNTLPWWEDGGTFTRGIYYSLYIYDSKKKEVKRLTPEGFSVFTFKVTPDGKSAYMSGDSLGPVLFQTLAYPSFWKLDIGKKKLTQIVKASDKCTVTNFTLGKDYGVIMMTDFRCGLLSDSDFYTLDYETGKTKLLKKWDRRIESTVYNDVTLYTGQLIKLEGDTLYFTSTVDEEHPLFKLENGEITRINEGEGVVGCFDVFDGKVILAGLFDMKAQELYTGCGKQLTHFNDKQLKGKYIAKPERLNIDSEGRDIRGFVYKPINYEPGKKYPAIMFIHGGPKSDLGPVFFNMFQYWCSEGYFVFCCDPYGSDGRGSEFGDMRAKYFTNDYADLMNFTDTVLAKYKDIDKKNVFETGISYGGIMTNWIIGHTDRFAACVSQNSISNLTSFTISDIGAAFVDDQFQGSTWRNFDFVWEKSPLKHADKAKTPTLFIHCINDYRCPLSEGLQMYEAIRRNGVDAKCFLIRGESHALFEVGGPKHRVRYTKEITRWFEEHKG